MIPCINGTRASNISFISRLCNCLDWFSQLWFYVEQDNLKFFQIFQQGLATSRITKKYEKTFAIRDLVVRFTLIDQFENSNYFSGITKNLNMLQLLNIFSKKYLPCFVINHFAARYSPFLVWIVKNVFF